MAFPPDLYRRFIPASFAPNRSRKIPPPIIYTGGVKFINRPTMGNELLFVSEDGPGPFKAVAEAPGLLPCLCPYAPALTVLGFFVGAFGLPPMQLTGTYTDDYVLFKSRNGSGTHTYLDPFGFEQYTFGNTVYEYFIDGMGNLSLRFSPATPDHLLRKHGFTGVSGEEYDATKYSTTDLDKDILVNAPPSNPLNPDPDKMVVTSRTNVSKDPAGINIDPAADGSIDLADQCVWSDLVAAATAFAATGSLYSDLGAAVSLATGDGMADGLNTMQLIQGKYRLGPLANKCTVRWKEVTRRNTPVFYGASATYGFGRYFPSSYLEELSSAITYPIRDRYGFHARGTPRWDQVPEQTADAYAYQNAAGGEYVLTAVPITGGSFRETAKFRFRLSTLEAGYTVRVNIKHYDPSFDLSDDEFVDLDVTDGFTDYVERAIADLGTDSYMEIAGWTLYQGGVLVTGDHPELKLLLRTRERDSIIGWAPFDSLLITDADYWTTRYLTKTITSALSINGSTNTGSIAFVTTQSYDGDAGELSDPVVVTATADLNGTSWTPCRHADPAPGVVDGHVTIIGTATTQGYTDDRDPADDSKFADFDASEPLGEVLDTVDQEVTIDTGDYTDWFFLLCSTRGAAIFIEDINAEAVA